MGWPTGWWEGMTMKSRLNMDCPSLLSQRGVWYLSGGCVAVDVISSQWVHSPLDLTHLIFFLFYSNTLLDYSPRFIKWHTDQPHPAQPGWLWWLPMEYDDSDCNIPGLSRPVASCQMSLSWSKWITAGLKRLPASLPSNGLLTERVLRTPIDAICISRCEQHRQRKKNSWRWYTAVPSPFVIHYFTLAAEIQDLGWVDINSTETRRSAEAKSKTKPQRDN